MPLTPYHLGPSSWIGLLFFKFLDFPTLLVASVIVDVEPFLVLLFNLNYPLHGFFHSFLGGAIAAILTAAAIYLFKHPIQKVMASLKLTQKSTIPKIFWTSFFGIYLHITLDSFLYTDIKPFFPSRYNLFYGWFSPQQIYFFSSFSFLIGITMYLFKLKIFKKLCKK